MHEPLAPAPNFRRRLLSSLHPGSLAVSIGFGFAAAVMFNPVFVVPFPILLARTLFLAMVLLLVFAATQQVPESHLPAWMPRWLLTVLAVGLAAPLGTFVIYMVSVDGRVTTFIGNPARLAGFFIIASTGLVLGLLITLTAQLREREARARSQALQFELVRSQLERQAADARLSLLQAQIEPHFLFNTLANVQALVEEQSPRAGPVLNSLIAYLRAAMPRLHDEAPTLGAELELVGAYLELMQMRMPDRLSFALTVPPALHARPFPAMALLTLVENAVHHGLDPSEHGGHIEIGGAGDAHAKRVRLWVQDSGVGMAETAATGTGLVNLRARTQAFFGPSVTLTLSEVQPHGLRAELVFDA